VNAVTIFNLGSELVTGETVNTNAAYIAHQLTRRGLRVRSVVAVPDDRELARRSIEQVLEEEGVFIFTGGLGGTRDDITRNVISSVLGRELAVDQERARLLEGYYRSRGRAFLEADLMQAACPEGGRLLENQAGMAYGFYLRDRSRYIFSIPGVPREMISMLDTQVLPILEMEGLFDPSCRSLSLLFGSVSEYALDREVAAVVENYPGVEYGTRAHYGLIRIRLEKRETDPRADSLQTCARELQSALGDYLVCTGERSIAQVVGDELQARGMSLVCAESCTGGWLAKMITDVPGSSGWFQGGAVVYSNELKKRLLGVQAQVLEEHGAVSAPTAAQMAQGAVRALGGDIAVSITGIAGPGGGTEEKPVGTVFMGVCTREGDPETEGFQHGSDRESIRLFSVNRTLIMLLRVLRRGNS
jgi:nicotinamide-nucleotide amidase